MCWLVLCQLDTIFPQNWPIGKFVRYFTDYCLLWEGPAYCRQCRPWPSGLELYKKTGWASPEEQPSKQHTSMACSLVPASRFLPWLPVLVSPSDGIQPVNQINLFFRGLLLTICFFTGIETRTKFPSVVSTIHCFAHCNTCFDIAVYLV